MSLDEALNFYQVCFRNPEVAWWPGGLEWGVSSSDYGIIALFATESAACHYRLMLVNQVCNPTWSK